MALSEKQLKELRVNIDNAEKALVEARTEAARAKRALIDTTVVDEQIKDLEKQLRHLKAVYY